MIIRLTSVSFVNVLVHDSLFLTRTRFAAFLVTLFSEGGHTGQRVSSAEWKFVLFRSERDYQGFPPDGRDHHYVCTKIRNLIKPHLKTSFSSAGRDLNMSSETMKYEACA